MYEFMQIPQLTSFCFRRPYYSWLKTWMGSWCGGGTFLRALEKFLAYKFVPTPPPRKNVPRRNTKSIVRSLTSFKLLLLKKKLFSLNDIFYYSPLAISMRKVLILGSKRNIWPFIHGGKDQHKSCTAHHGEPLLCPCLRTTCNYFFGYFSGLRYVASPSSNEHGSWWASNIRPFDWEAET